MRRIVLAALALSTPVLAGPAQAMPTAVVTYQGGCSFDAITDPTGTVTDPDTFTGQISAIVVAYTTDFAENPLPVTVTCSLMVNGVPAQEVEFRGPGVAAGAATLSYQASDADVVFLCEHVVAGGTDFGDSCPHVDHTHLEIPPGEFWETVDPLVCGALVALYGQGVTGIWDEQGDIDAIWECPPYGV